MSYTIVKQNRKTAAIVITEQYEVIVKVPKYMTKKQIETLVLNNEAWIRETIEKKKERIMKHDWYYTKKLMFLGKEWPVKLVLETNAKQTVDFTDKGFIIVSDDSESHVRRLVELFYKKEAKEKLTKLSHHYAEIVGVQYGKITIRNQKTRWGSCSSKGNLSYNLKILCAPEEMIEYVVLHEVMHLKHFNHSQMFWKEIESIMPDYKKRMNYFRQFGQNFMI